MKHRWNLETRIPASESRDGNERTERECPYCHWVKITAHPRHGFAFRIWRSPDGVELRQDNLPAECTGGGNNVIERPREVQAI